MKKQTHEILFKLLNLVPVLHANPGIKVNELRKISGFENNKDLHDNLNRLLMFGTPPFSPDNFIEIYIDDEDRVFLNLPQGLERPLDLTSSEWISLHRVIEERLRFHASGEETNEHLSAVLARITQVPVIQDTEFRNEGNRKILEEALEEKLQIEFQYRSLSSKEMEIRRVDPWALFHHRGVDYLIGYCYLRESVRYFHLERMKDIEILDMKQEAFPPENIHEILKKSPIFQDSPSGYTVEIAFKPELYPAMEWYFRIRETKKYTGENETMKEWLTAKCKVHEGIWFRHMVRSFGPDVVIVSPKYLRKAYREELDEISIPAGFDG